MRATVRLRVLVAAFLLAFLWQGFDGWFRALGIAGYMPPIVAAWATDALFLVVGTALVGARTITFFLDRMVRI